jgi:flagellar motility protein MotE (MotC chaperone)
MARVYTGNYTTDAAKVAKKSERLTCQVTDDGTIFVADGYFAWKMNPLEYAAIVQPVSCCEAGNWTIDKSGKSNRNFDIADIFTKTVEAVKDAAPLTACPLCFTVPKHKELLTAYHNAAAGFAAFYNSVYLAAITTGATLKTEKALSPAVAFRSGEPFAIVMPIKAADEAARAVKAYFTTDDNAKHNNDNTTSAEADELRVQLTIRNDQLLKAREQIAEQTAELDALREQIATMQAAPVEEKQEPKTAAEIIAARFAELPGVTATVKGAQTAAPVVWLAGDTEHNAEAIKASGAKWSSKKAAYYYRVA